MICLADTVDAHGEGSWYSYGTMARQTSLSRSEIIRCVKTLEDEIGCLTRLGKHPVYGTIRWKIIAEKIPMHELTEAQWRYQFNAIHKGARTIGSFRDLMELGGVTVAPPEHSSEPPDLPGGGATVERGGCHSDTLSCKKESTKIDSDSSVPEALFDLGPADPAKKPAECYPQTDLEKLLISLCGRDGNAKYLGPTAKKASQVRESLNLKNAVTPKGQFTVLHPSCEDEWKREPEKFAAYVRVCASLIGTKTGSNGIKLATLISTVRGYGRYNNGWIAYQKAKGKVEDAAASTSGKYYQADVTMPWE